MVHPVLRLLATQPQLLADHAEAYAELVSAELASVSAALKRRAVLTGLALCSLTVAAILAGVAVMLWAVVPSAQMPAPWALIATPLPALALAGWSWLAARPDGARPAFADLRRQLKADLLMLREVSGP